MTDSDNHSGNQRNQWSPEDRRTFIITFVAGVASIIVAAGVVGLAVALARALRLGNNSFTWTIAIVVPVLCLLALIEFVRDKEKMRSSRFLIWVSGAVVAFFALVWIGVGAGIH